MPTRVLDTMPDFNTAAYANHPIQIPAEFPKILKQYTKAAIRTQPKDLLLWSVAYFRCLTNGEIPPVKERLEYPVPPTESGLTPGLLRVLNKQLGRSEVVQKADLQGKWRGICLALHHLEEILHQGGLTGDNIPWLPFLVEAAAATSIVPSSLEQQQQGGSPPTVVRLMEILCEVLSDHPEGVSSALAQAGFVAAFRLVAKRQEVAEATIEEAERYFAEAALRQGGMLVAANIRSAECPSLD